MQILRASEDYLEAMLMMQKEHGYVRSIDIAEKLGVTKPSVTYATKRLRENGYITMDKDGLITLTEQGMSIASSMLDRHQTLTRFLMALGVDRETAEADACKMEHDISQTSFEAICRHARDHLEEMRKDAFARAKASFFAFTGPRTPRRPSFSASGTATHRPAVSARQRCPCTPPRPDAAPPAGSRTAAPARSPSRPEG